MVLLTTAGGEFHARVLAARLGADGIFTQVRGVSSSPYPVLSRMVEVMVDEDDFETACLLLLADEVDSVLEAALDDDILHDPDAPLPADGPPRWVVAFAVLAIAGLACASIMQLFA